MLESTAMQTVLAKLILEYVLQKSYTSAMPGQQS